MSYPITNADVAGILDALGKPAAAETVRWGEPPLADVVDERDDLKVELANADDVIERLEALLCASCRKNWKAQQ